MQVLWGKNDDCGCKEEELCTETVQGTRGTTLEGTMTKRPISPLFLGNKTKMYSVGSDTIEKSQRLQKTLLEK